MSLPERFWAKVDKSSECWVWTGSIRPNGYGQFFNGRRTDAGNPRAECAHRVVYAALVGDIPEGHHVHHDCGTRACVNPAHLLLLSASAHAHETRAAPGIDLCIRGHALDFTHADGRRGCRTCRRAAVSRYKARQRAARKVIAGMSADDFEALPR